MLKLILGRAREELSLQSQPLFICNIAYFKGSDDDNDDEDKVDGVDG